MISEASFHRLKSKKLKDKMRTQKNRSKSISKMIRRLTEQSAGASEYEG